MSSNIHDKILNLIKKGALGTLSVAECTFQHETFVPLGSIDTGKPLEKMRDHLYDVLMAGSHPTLNPFVDEVMEISEGVETFKEGLLLFLEKNSTNKKQKCDSKNDVMTTSVKAEILTINCLPFFDQEEIKIVKASIQTALFKYDIEE